MLNDLFGVNISPTAELEQIWQDKKESNDPSDPLISFWNQETAASIPLPNSCS